MRNLSVCHAHLLHGVLGDDVLEVVGLAEGLDGLQGLLDGVGGHGSVEELEGLRKY